MLLSRGVILGNGKYNGNYCSIGLVSWCYIRLYIGIVERKWKLQFSYSILGLYKVLYRDSGKENGNY